ncbi:chemotaxis protein CheD [Terrilactibacillus sp. S3-3]|nr:chemotaxis protein CheD [Terrilactibacillus sp. S3-3]
MIHVGLSEIKVASSPESLRTMGLGSCVGVVLYNEEKKIAGMAHVMLPTSTLARTEDYPPGKFADTAVPELVRILTTRGAKLSQLKAKMAGGAEMFKAIRPSPLGSIGKRNVLAVKDQLKQFRIPVVAEETGKNYGRTIEFYIETGKLFIRAINKDEKMI